MFFYLRFFILVLIAICPRYGFGHEINRASTDAAQVSEDNVQNELKQEIDAEISKVLSPEDQVPAIVLPRVNFLQHPLIYLDNKQQSISGNILEMAEKIDSFFGAENYQKVNKSRVKIDLSTLFVEGKKPQQDVKVKARLSLPRTQKKLNLVIDSLATPEQEVAQKQDPTRVKEDENFSASLRYFFKNDKYWKFSTDAGIVARLPLDPFTKAYGHRRFYFGLWTSQLSEKLFWFHSDGFGAITDLHFLRPLAEGKFLFRIGSEATYLESIDRILMVQSISLSHKLNDISGLVYGAAAAGENKPSIHINSYTIFTSYRRKLYKDWLFMNITPSGSWVRSERFTFTPAIEFRIEILFGKI